MIPITDELFDKLRELYPSEKTDPYSEFWKLSGSLEIFSKTLSDEGSVMYVETEYFGGVGEQAAIVWKDSQLLMPPKKADSGPINEGLQLIGVVCEPDFDEFDTVGLGHHRSNEDWVE